ncbi:MAG: hypothetical protein KDC10_00990 [Calditrichaeota bacterium]|nr:hypothetical protein [Calditrichota bacterium]MCB9472257.1 hypothetical protein [Candidatus Delongbacteria bacterium]
MTIQHRTRNDRDIYHLKGALDDAGWRQLDFIVHQLGARTGRLLQLDFHQTRGSDQDAHARHLKRLTELARDDRSLRFAGIAPESVRHARRLGLPRSLFV